MRTAIAGMPTPATARIAEHDRRVAGSAALAAWLLAKGDLMLAKAWLIQEPLFSVGSKPPAFTSL